MIVYLAGNPAEHEQFNGYAQQLEADGHQVVSTWHRDDKAASTMQEARDQREAMANFAWTSKPSVTDLEGAADRFNSEIDNVDSVVAELPTAAMEAGYAVAKGIRVIAIGSSESMMIPLFGEQIELMANWGAALAALRGRRMRRILARPLPVHENS